MFWVIAATLGQYRLNLTIKGPRALRAGPSTSVILIWILNAMNASLSLWLHTLSAQWDETKKKHGHGNPSKLKATRPSEVCLQ